MEQMRKRVNVQMSMRVSKQSCWQAKEWTLEIANERASERAEEQTKERAKDEKKEWMDKLMSKVEMEQIIKRENMDAKL